MRSGPEPKIATTRLLRLSESCSGVFQSNVFKCRMSKCSLLTSSARGGYDGILEGNIRTDLQFHRHFDEWHSRNLLSYVRGLYDQAIADGFPSWR
jgi:hypothetical protein